MSYILSISDVRKRELLECCKTIMTNIPTGIKGHRSLAELLITRISTHTQKPDEFKFLVDIVTTLIQKSKGKEIQIYYKGRLLTKEDLARDFGLILPKGQHVLKNPNP